MQDLLQAGNSLSNLSEVLNDFLKSVISTWSQLYSILVQSLQSKHGFGKVEKQDITGPCGCEVGMAKKYAWSLTMSTTG